MTLDVCVCDQRVSVPWRKKSRDHSEAMGRIRKERKTVQEANRRGLARQREKNWIIRKVQ